MINGARRLPSRHITIRVPWHDNGWSDHACEHPGANTYCSILRGIAAFKSDAEDTIAGQKLIDLPADRLPPCVDERGTFMSKHDLVLTKTHLYKDSNPKTHGHYGPTQLRLLARSPACVPFSWMLRERAEAKIEALQLGFDEAKEPELNFNTAWIQAYDNQAVMLDTFFSAIQPERSLCFFYAKKTPLPEDPRRVIIGVGQVTEVGGPTPYKLERQGPANLLWERCVRHSIREAGENGFLLPYYDLLAAAEGVYAIIQAVERRRRLVRIPVTPKTSSAVEAGHSASKTRVNALMSRPPRFGDAAVRTGS
jgi:hypothetical protein